MTENKLTIFLEKRRKTLLLTVALALFAVFALYYFFLIFRSPAEVPARQFAVLFLAAAAVGCGILLICYFVMTRKNLSTEKLFVIFMATAGVIYAAVFLPFTIPDEHAHYLSAYRISNYLTFNFEQFGEERLLLRSTDAELLSKLRASYLTPDYYASIIKNFDFFSADRQVIAMPSVFVKNAPLGYIASSFGIALGRLFRLGAIPTFYLGRFANLALYTVAVWWAMKRIPYGKTALFVISALPMTIHLVASYSYDFIVIALVMLFISQVLYMREKPGTITLKDIILCAVWAALLAPSKLVYFVIVFAVFIIPSEKFGTTGKRAAMIKIGIAALSIAVLLISQIGKISTYIGDGNVVKWSQTEALSVSYALSHPLDFIRILVNTFFKKTDFYLATMIGSHMGSLQITVPVFIWLPMLGVLFFTFIRRKDEEIGVLSAGGKLWMWLLAGLTCLLASLSILFSWTPLTSSTIEGVQGRYFIPALPLIFLAIRGNGLTRPANSDKYIIFFCVYYNLLMPLVYFGTVFA